MKVSISQIKIGDRQRSSLTDIDKLASSIQRFGLLHPIVVDREMNLIAGRRRLEAHITLREENIEATFRDELSPLQRKELELEENIQRVDLSWAEQCDAREELDRIKKELYGEKFQGREEGWNLSDTAIALGESESLVRHDVMLSKAMKVMPELRKCKTKSEAFNVLKRERTNIKRAAFAKEIDRRIKENPEEQLVQIIEGDCLKVLEGMEEESVDMCICDPPFGVNLDGIAEAVGAKYGKYEDDKRTCLIFIAKWFLKSIMFSDQIPTSTYSFQSGKTSIFI